TLDLEAHGLRWIRPRASVAHPLDDEPAVLLTRSLAETAGDLGADGAAYRALFGPLLRAPHALLADLLGPLRLPRHPLLMARFGMTGLWPARRARRLRGARDPAARAPAHDGRGDALRAHGARRRLARRRRGLAGHRPRA